jgi:hypothetical protein
LIGFLLPENSYRKFACIAVDMDNAGALPCRHSNIALVALDLKGSI